MPVAAALEYKADAVFMFRSSRVTCPEFYAKVQSSGQDRSRGDPRGARRRRRVDQGRQKHERAISAPAKLADEMVYSGKLLMLGTPR
jgi:hypothetical protein